MTLRKWITLASAAALIAGTGACKDNAGGSSATKTSPGSSTDPQGRRADTPSRLRADAGTAETGTSGSSSPSAPAPTDTAGSPGSTSGSSSGSSSGDTTKR